MIKKYNLALLPERTNQSIVALVSKFKINFGQYKLGDGSLAHLTLLQFYIDENLIGEIWKTVCDSLVDHQITLNFDHYSYVTFDGHTYWLSLLPDKRDILNNMHLEICSLLNVKNKKDFDPHMTLFNTNNMIPEMMLHQLERPDALIVDDFILSLGACDEVGQVTKVEFK